MLAGKSTAVIVLFFSLQMQKTKPKTKNKNCVVGSIESINKALLKQVLEQKLNSLHT